GIDGVAALAQDPRGAGGGQGMLGRDGAQGAAFRQGGGWAGPRRQKQYDPYYYDKESKTGGSSYRKVQSVSHFI
ncbi:MAG TPA: hypothetical protein DF383_01520, partial [Deltaproteobacteria bacterium]|nr:hypothetical protein [Deltaproteobacteria bacterium]